MLSKIRYGLLISLVVIGLFVMWFGNAHAETINYIYDELNRLKRVEYGDGSAIEYTYDSAGNRATLVWTRITVVSPNGGESWKKNSTHAIIWGYTGNPGSYVKIELLKGGVVNLVITSSTSIGSGGSGSYDWRIPGNQTQGSDYKIRVTSTSNGSYTDTSDNYFSITK